MDKKQLDALSKRYNKAKAFETVIKSEGWQEVCKEFRTMADKTASEALEGRYGAEEHDRLVAARNWLFVLSYVENKASKVENLKKQLEAEGLE